MSKQTYALDKSQRLDDYVDDGHNHHYDHRQHGQNSSRQSTENVTPIDINMDIGHTKKPPQYSFSPEAGAAHLLMHLRGQGLLDRCILNSFAQMSRAHFVPEILRKNAYKDIALPVFHHQLCYAPSQYAAMLVGMDLKPQGSVLVIGAGSGYLLALLSCLTKRVYCIEPNEATYKWAKEKINQMAIDNIELVYHHRPTWPHALEFDRVIIAGIMKDDAPDMSDMLSDRSIFGFPNMVHVTDHYQSVNMGKSGSVNANARFEIYECNDGVMARISAFYGVFHHVDF